MQCNDDAPIHGTQPSSIEALPDELPLNGFRPTDAIAKFTYKNKTYRTLAKNVTPSELARKFKIKIDGIQVVQGRDRDYKVIQDKDIFCPLLAPASYEIVYDPLGHIAKIIEVRADSKPLEAQVESGITTQNGKTKDSKIQISWDEKILETSEATAQPSVISSFFGVAANQLRLKRGNEIYEVHERADCFEPELVPGKYQLLSEMGLNEESTSRCNIITENGVTSHDVQKCSMAEIQKLLTKSVDSPSDILKPRLFTENGNLVDFEAISAFEEGKTYYLSFFTTALPPTKFPNVKHFYAGLTFNRPMAFMAPYLIAALRSMAIFSTSGANIPLKPPKHDHAKRQNLLCNSSLSTAAFQVTYRINDVAKALQLITNKISNDKLDGIDHDAEFEENSDQPGALISEFVMDFPAENLDLPIKLLKKALVDTEELLDLVVECMKDKQPTIESVEIALIVEKGKHQRREQKIVFENIIDENDEGEYRDIAQKDYRILPQTSVKEVSNSRQHFTCIDTLVKQLIASGNPSTPDLKPIAHLLNIVAEILHCIYLHWRFSQEFLIYQENYFGKDQKRLSVSDVCLTVSQQLKSCALIWNYVGRSTPFFIDIHEKKDITQLWKKYMVEINASQYALELCYLTKKYLASN